MEEDKRFNARFSNEIYDLLETLSHKRYSTKTQVVIDGILAIAAEQQAGQMPNEILDEIRDLKATQQVIQKSLEEIHKISDSQQATQKALEEIRWMITKLKD